jgi:hypothetical protein
VPNIGIDVGNFVRHPDLEVMLYICPGCRTFQSTIFTVYTQSFCMCNLPLLIFPSFQADGSETEDGIDDTGKRVKGTVA